MMGNAPTASAGEMAARPSARSRVAALYVETNGVYYGLPDVDLWDEARDARLYAGPWPVVAHPPCRTWSIMSQCRPEIQRGADGGCFWAALDAVREFGGVLEHPAHSLAWRQFGLAYPMSAGWTRSLVDDGWTCQVDQAMYGHAANKITWLYYVGPEPPELRWGRAPFTGRAVRSDGGGGRDQRSKTPPAFRDVLLDMARSARTRRCDYRYDPESRCDGVYETDGRCDQCGRRSPRIQGQAQPC